MSEWCRVCGNANPTVLETHHIVPRRYGGGNKDENLVTLCSNCHTAIETIYDDRFYEELGFNPRTQNSGVQYNKTVELVKEFLDNNTIVGDGGHERTEKLYAEFKHFVRKQKRGQTPHKVQFGKALKDIHPVDISRGQLRFDGDPKNVYKNVKLID